MNPVNLELPDQKVSISQRPLMSLVAAIGAGGLVAFVYYPILRNLVHQWWTDPNFSQGFIVPLFSLYLLWSMRKSLSAS